MVELGGAARDEDGVKVKRKGIGRAWQGIEGYGIGVRKEYIGDDNGIESNMEENDRNRTTYARRQEEYEKSGAYIPKEVMI